MGRWGWDSWTLGCKWRQISEMDQMMRESELKIPIILPCLEEELFGSEVLCLRAHRDRSKTTVGTQGPWRRNGACQPRFQAPTPTRWR